MEIFSKIGALIKFLIEETMGLIKVFKEESTGFSNCGSLTWRKTG